MQQLYAKVIDEEQHQGVTIIDGNNNIVGDVFATTISGCDEKNAYGFQHVNGAEILLGLQRRRFKDLNVAKYTVEYMGKRFIFKERKFHNFMNFRADGIVLEIPYIFKDDKEVTLTMHREEDLIGLINDHKIFVEDISDIEVGLLILMYFMFKLYKREDYHIARILHRNW